MCDCDAFLKCHEIFVIDHHISCSVQREADADTCARHGLSVRTLRAMPLVVPPARIGTAASHAWSHRGRTTCAVVYGTMDGPGDFSKDAVF